MVLNLMQSDRRLIRCGRLHNFAPVGSDYVNNADWSVLINHFVAYLPSYSVKHSVQGFFFVYIKYWRTEWECAIYYILDS